MSRRLLFLLLVPALVGAALGAGAGVRLEPLPAAARALDGSAARGDSGRTDDAWNRAVADAERRAAYEAAAWRRRRAARELRREAVRKALVLYEQQQREERERRERQERRRQERLRREEQRRVERVQRRLTELRYYVGPVDGKAGAQTVSAVMAFQKVNRLTVDGVIGPQTLAALDDPVSPALRGGPPDRVEVDLTAQVLYLVDDGELVRILPVSSGSGETYPTAGGGVARALTPVGDYVVERRIRGLRQAALGSLYDPLYFYKGWAIHGSSSVPAYPASHGCVRVSRADSVWLFDRVPVGTAVSLYGGTHIFAAGSSAAGTSVPAGDTGTAAVEAPESDG